jgi:dipeptidyl aminopeptidase/acylaminoacyl peptidase
MKLLNYLPVIFVALSIFGCSKPETNNKATIEPINNGIEQQAILNTQYSAEQFFQTTTVFGSKINHSSDAVLVSSDASGVFNAYRYPLDGSGPRQLTMSTKNTVYAVSWFPEDERFLFSQDQGGNELSHLYVQKADGTAHDLTPGENVRASFMGWLNDHSFYVMTNERDAKAMDVYRYSSADFTRELVFENTSMLDVSASSNDGRYLVLGKALSGADSDLYLVDLQSTDKLVTLISTTEGPIEESAYSFTADSTSLIYGTNEFGEFNQAWRYELSSGERALFYKDDWDVSFVDFSKDGKYSVIGVNTDAQTQLSITEISSGGLVQLPRLPKGDLRGVGFSKDSTKMVFYINSDTSPSNLYSYTMGEANVKQLSNSLNPQIQESVLVASEVVRFKSFDGLEIPGLLYKPNIATINSKVPALVWVHGGPGGQSRQGYAAAIQHLVNQGYAIFAVNNRGSSGYGKTFYHLDDKNHGENDLQDIVYGKKHLQTLSWIDADRIGIIGGSYGGYMTMAGMAFTDEFKVGINIFGVTNWLRTLKSIPPWWESFKTALYDEMGDPATDEERLRRISPLFHADKIKNPVLVVQGANDPRVLQIESDEMVAAIKANNVPVEYVLFDDEGHGFRKKANRITASNAYLAFLQKYL